MEIALIAHNGKKPEMVKFIMDKIDLLKHKNISIIATGTTGKYVEETGLKVTKYLSGPLGGDAEIAARVAEEKTDMVIFFRDPMDKHPHEPDISMLMRICDVHNVPLATNPAAADLFFKALLK
ncbi:MAG TPA: methylglyoxal synthase [Saprospiraceae bacterium]|nr:methylglyoxal synthase [Saprospiraceae bacterium]HHH54092.1 methylglyoxal synthase [Bacteroidota bacterium]